MEEFGYIYGLINPETNIIFYIGRTIKPRTRLTNHMSPSNLAKNSTCCLYLRDLKERNIVPKLIILCKCKLVNINRMEKKYISIYRKINPNLTNERIGGDGWNMKKKLPPSNWNNAIESNKKKVIIRNIETNEEQILNSVLECAEYLKSHITNVSACLKKLKGKRSVKGHYIRYFGEEFEEPERLTNLYKFKGVNIQDNSIKIIDYSDFKKEGYDTSYIYAACNGRRKQAYGYKWEKVLK